MCNKIYPAVVKKNTKVICFFYIYLLKYYVYYMYKILSFSAYECLDPCLPSSTVRVMSSFSLLTFSVRSWCCPCLDTCSSVSSSASFRKLSVTQKQLCSTLLPIFYNLHTLTSILMQPGTYIVWCIKKLSCCDADWDKLKWNGRLEVQ